MAKKLLYTVTGLSSEDVKAITDMGVDVVRRGMGHYIYSDIELDTNTINSIKKYLQYSEDDGVEFTDINEGINMHKKKLHEKDAAFNKVRETLLKNMRRLQAVEHNQRYINEDERAGEILMIKVNNYPWYLNRIDSTHFFMADTLDAARNRKGVAYHIGQHRDKPYYSDINDWLVGQMSTDELYGQEY